LAAFGVLDDFDDAGAWACADIEVAKIANATAILMNFTISPQFV
jgi:hypothetical protein